MGEAQPNVRTLHGHSANRPTLGPGRHRGTDPSETNLEVLFACDAWEGDGGLEPDAVSEAAVVSVEALEVCGGSSLCSKVHPPDFQFGRIDPVHDLPVPVLQHGEPWCTVWWGHCFGPSAQWVTDETGERIDVDWLGRLEDVDTDLPCLEQILEHNPARPLGNVNPTSSRLSYNTANQDGIWSAEDALPLLDMVHTHFAADFELFGYSIDPAVSTRHYFTSPP